MKKLINIFLKIIFFFSVVYGYIGPGMGLGLILTILGIVCSLLLGILGIIYYPIKRFLKNIKKK